jgi:hypothetical protein
MSSATEEVHARRRSPVSIQTQQSWQAPIKQNPDLASPPNSAVRSRGKLSNIATNKLSPDSAVAASPSTEKLIC